MICSQSPLSFGCQWTLSCDGAGWGWTWLRGLVSLSILHSTYVRISGVLGLGGGPEACQQEDKKKMISNLEDFSCFAEMSCSLLPCLPSPLHSSFLPGLVSGQTI